MSRRGRLRYRASRLRRRARLAWDGRFGPLPSPRKWAFIVGCYNSGTRLLHDLLASHPNVGSMPYEGQFFTDQFTLPKAAGLARAWALAPERFRLDETGGPDIDVERLKRQWGATYDDPTRPVLLEKTPTNAARMRWLQRHFDNAHFIAVVRNGYAVAEGIRRKVGHPVEVGAEQWARSNEIMLGDLGALSRWRLIRYEALAAAPDAVLEELLAFLELPPVAASPSHRAWTVHGQVSWIRDMNAESLAALSEADRLAIRRVAGEMLRHLGYEE